jgi:hypothetical protein
MAFKPNYNQLRNDRNRAKEAKKNEKKRQLEEETARRRASSPSEDEAPIDENPVQ